MRNKQQMFDLILQTAKQDDRIRAVYMNGSRANPHAPKDIFQDYDIVYVVTETASFIANEGWIKRFGEILVMQKPDELDKIMGNPTDFDRGYTYLMQFTDGNRIDLHIETKESTLAEYGADSLTVPLLDKDHLLPKIPESNDSDYHVRKPTAEEFMRCCNEFWWVAPYAAKGLWRQEIIYSLDCMNHYIRMELITMLTWQVGIQTDFSLSVGKSAKYLKKYLTEKTWEKLLKTYPSADYEAAWQAILTMCDLFEDTAVDVAERLGFDYNQKEGQNSFSFIKHIHHLPKDAEEIY